MRYRLSNPAPLGVVSVIAMTVSIIRQNRDELVDKLGRLFLAHLVSVE